MAPIRTMPAAPPAAPPGRLGVWDLVRRARGTDAPRRGALERAQVLVAFSFGAGRGGSVSQANRQLGAIADRFPQLPLLAQTEVARAATARGRLVVDLEALVRESNGLGPTAYVDTAAVARAAVELASRAGWDTVGVIAHPSHAGRCVAILETAGLRAVVPPEVLGVGFDPGSRQWWTRSRRSWLLREVLVLTHQRLVGNL